MPVFVSSSSLKYFSSSSRWRKCKNSSPYRVLQSYYQTTLSTRWRFLEFLLGFLPLSFLVLVWLPSLCQIPSCPELDGWSGYIFSLCRYFERTCLWSNTQPTTFVHPRVNIERTGKWTVSGASVASYPFHVGIHNKNIRRMIVYDMRCDAPSACLLAKEGKGTRPFPWYRRHKM